MTAPMAAVRAAELLKLKTTHFVLWRPGITHPAPRLVIGTFQSGNPPMLANPQFFNLVELASQSDLWGIPAKECQLANDTVYHYWFEVMKSHPVHHEPSPLFCTDPTAWTVDWRILSPFGQNGEVRDSDRYPAGVVLYRNEQLELCDPGKEQIDWDGDPPLDQLPKNNQLIIYELPTRWARQNIEGGIEVDVGTFRDVTALVEPTARPANFTDIQALEQGHAHISELGVNALELLPPADSFVNREWGYATSNYFAADYDLGLPERFQSPTASTDFVHLVKTCHQHRMRFFDDMVMAFATRSPYHTINYLDFFVLFGSGDPEEVVNGYKRDGFGGDLFKFNYLVDGYDPETGRSGHLFPARQFLYTHLKHWMDTYRIDGIRMDSIPNIANWDFIRDFKDKARQHWLQRWQDQNLPAENGADARFLVIGEDLPISSGLLTEQRIDALWNENFKRIVRNVILGKNDDTEPSFEWSVRKLIDCRLLSQGTEDGAQAINYVTSHDVGGFRNERLFNFLLNNGISETEQRIKLAFVCLLTAIGIPMILAGEEFADQHDLPVTDSSKQVDPVNFQRSEEPWRRRIFEYVTRLVTLRRTNPALSVNDTTFLHVDFNEEKRVLVWLRGQAGTRNMVVVVANFSDYGTPAPLSGQTEYVVHNWPILPKGTHWHEVTQDRPVDPNWAGRESIFPWEAKVYTVVG